MSETYRSILERLKNNLPGAAASIEGTFSGNNILTVANELARIYSQDIDPLLLRAFACTAAGNDLDKIGTDIGVIRKESTYAEVIVIISGNPGEYDPVIVAADSILFTTDSFTIPDTGTANVRAVCKVAGVGGNVQAGTINTVKTTGVALTAVTNTVAASGGYETEDDASYRARILARKQNIVTGGNREQYRQWALSVEGVIKAKVIDLYKGPGTVGIYIVAEGNVTAGPDLIDNVAAYIETVRPCGAGVTVLSANPVQINVSATVLLAAGSLETIQKQYIELLQKYMDSVPFVYGSRPPISYLRTADLLLQVDGVEDVTNIMINGQTESIRLEEIQFPVIGEITLQETVQTQTVE